MGWNRNLQKARRVLDRRLTPLQPAIQYQPPPKGWIRALRNSIGMSSAQLGKAIGVRSQSVDDMEKAEVSGGVTLETLRRVGKAMDCTLVYALVPNTSLESLVMKRAEALAASALAEVAHTMALEDQKVDGDRTAQITEYIEDHISERDLWPRK